MKEYVVVVLGDLGRSPRMQNHAVCLSKLPDARVHLVGYNESPLFAELQKANNIVVHPIKPFKTPKYIPFVLYAPFKILWLLLQLLMLIFTLPRFELVLAQNPPTIPTLPFCWLLCKVKGKRFVIDWHNLGWSILSVNGRKGVGILKSIEYKVGRLSDGNLAVTEALKKHLTDNGIESVVVYDKPSDLFKPTRELRGKYAKMFDIDEESIWIISSTSWTPDEKTDLILDAADKLDAQLGESKLRMTIIITGRGPNKRAFEAEVKGRNYDNIEFRLEFLTYEDYAALLGCCDAGVSLHISSSNFDLPMKGLDMLGAGLPLLSVSYPCITELVSDRENGVLFDGGKGTLDGRSAYDLAAVIKDIFIDKTIDIAKLREGAVESGSKKWAAIWDECAKSTLLGNK